MLPFQICLSSRPYSSHAPMIWEIRGKHPFQFHHHWTSCQLLQQLPKGHQSNVVYNSLSIHSCNLAQAITTLLSPKVLSQNHLWLPQVVAFGHWSKQIQRHFFLDSLMFVLQVSVTQRSLLTQNTSVTLTHICRGAPTHSITAMAGVSPWMSRPARRGQTNLLICL